MKAEYDYNKFLRNNGITNETNIKRREFKHKMWDKLSSEIQLDRMLRLTNVLLIIDDSWAKKKLAERRIKRIERLNKW